VNVLNKKLFGNKIKLKNLGDVGAERVEVCKRVKGRNYWIAGCVVKNISDRLDESYGVLVSEEIEWLSEAHKIPPKEIKRRKTVLNSCEKYLLIYWEREE